ncbi:MAG: NAD(P)-dependent oxidoreductase [Proteobacteria bacterium]|nr:NAD(P)-dependent oxidoreductase [Pseudomonadota bacterium]
MMVRVGIVGTGFIARSVVAELRNARDLAVARVLTRRKDTAIDGIDAGTLTLSLDELLERCDIVLEASGDPLHATVVVESALASGKKVVTMNAEFHVTTGPYFHGRGYLTEAEGDQPGATALLKRDALGMGFRPMAYVNIKGFLEPNPTRANMEYWSERQGLSLVETTSFTDGTKLQIEQALCANALGAIFVRDGMTGRKVSDLAETDYLVKDAEKLGCPVSDYVVAAGAPPGVFLLAKHDVSRTLPHYGPYEKLLTKGRSAYVLLRPYHLCALEVPKTLRSAAAGDAPLMFCSPVPYASVAAVAKRALEVDEVIDHAIGGFEVRGMAVAAAAHPDHVPIGLLKGARVRRRVLPEAVLQMDDVELEASRAGEIWSILQQRVNTAADQLAGAGGVAG